MKKLLFFVLLTLVGCSSPTIQWQNVDQVTMAQRVIRLESNLWINMIPSLQEMKGEEVDRKPILGALILQSKQQLPAELNVQQVTIRQGQSKWLITSDEFDIRSHSPNQWEVAFQHDMALDTSKSVDIAVRLTDGKEEKIVFNNKVKVASVY